MNGKMALEKASRFLIFLLGGNPVTLYSFKKGYEGDPLSPPEREADQGEHPLVPPISPVSQRISRQPLISYRIFLSLPRRRGQKQRLPLPKRAPEPFSLDICRA